MLPHPRLRRSDILSGLALGDARGLKRLPSCSLSLPRLPSPGPGAVALVGVLGAALRRTTSFAHTRSCEIADANAAAGAAGRVPPLRLMLQRVVADAPPTPIRCRRCRCRCRCWCRCQCSRPAYPSTATLRAVVCLVLLSKCRCERGLVCVSQELSSFTYGYISSWIVAAGFSLLPTCISSKGFALTIFREHGLPRV